MVNWQSCKIIHEARSHDKKCKIIDWNFSVNYRPIHKHVLLLEAEC